MAVRHYRRRKSVHARRRSAKRVRGYTRHNPLMGMKDWGAGVAGAVTGGLLAIVVDRYMITSPIAASGTTPAAGSSYPVAVGYLPDGVAPAAPLWSNWKRMAAAGAAIAVPLGASMFVKGAGLKSFLQLAFFGALTTTGVKLAADGAARLLQTNATAQRLFAPELNAQNQVASPAFTNMGTTQTLQAGLTPGVLLAGPPKGTPYLASAQQYRTLGDAGCVPCCDGTETAATQPPVVQGGIPTTDQTAPGGPTDLTGGLTYTPPPTSLDVPPVE